ncbi:MAG: glycosyltransferase family 2 protein [Thermoanaerobaculia bacterium]
MSQNPLSILIHTYNEADQIVDCLRSVEWADEIFLIDGFSTDGTADIVRSTFPRVRVEQRVSLGSAAQKNYGMDRTAHDWILVIDADERATPALAAEVRRTLENPTRWAYAIGRRNFVLDREIRFSGLQNDRVTRLFHRGHARYPNRRVHADLVVDGEAGALDAKFDHYYVRSFDHMVAKMTRYGVWAAAQLWIDGRRSSTAKILLRPAGRFVREYVLQQGFRDGVRGLLVTGLHTFYVFWKYGKLWELEWRARRDLPLELPEVETDPAIWRRPWERRK